MPIEIIPSILAKTREELIEKIISIEPHADSVHLDIVDGIFVPNITIAGPEEIETVETGLKIGVHLMVSKPENHIVRWLETPADRFVFHVEATQKAREVIDAIKETDKLVGIAINPQTSTDKIKPFIDYIDFVHFMTVEPGFYGGKFMEPVLDKISDFHYFYPDKPIEVDGGVNPETAPRMIQAGASILVVGSYIWESKDIGKAIKELKSAISG
jgi:ribulose-phosphate 3-epimerase